MRSVKKGGEKMEVVWRCKEHNVEFTDRKSMEQHEWEFHTPFKKACLLNGKPCVGICTLKEHYESCQKPNVVGKVLMNNWMCWRDGILKERVGC